MTAVSTVGDGMQVFFTDEKMFYINPPVSTQNDRLWSAGRKRDVSSGRLLIERAKFAPRVMVSAGVCLQGKRHLHFAQEKSKVNGEYYVNELLPKLIDNCHHLLCQHLSKMEHLCMQQNRPLDWLRAHCPDVIDKDTWPPSSPDLNPLDYLLVAGCWTNSTV